MKKILIIEDEFIIANQLQAFLQAEGFFVIGPVDNYDEAIKLINITNPDLIIADIRLNDDIDAGIRISKYVSVNYNIPVIFLSGFSDKETLNKAKQTNANTFLVKPKPLDKIQLITTVKMALPEETFQVKAKKIPFKGKEIDILENYNTYKRHTNPDSITKLIDLKEILFFETYNHHFKNTILIRLSDSAKGFLIREELDVLEKKLPGYFFRVHKSYLVNMDRVTAHKLPHYLLVYQNIIPIGSKNRMSVIQFFNRV